MIDAHQHFWSAARGDYAWMTPDLGPLLRDFGPEDLAPLMAEASIDRTVLVQAAEAETDFLLAIAQRTPFVAGVRLDRHAGPKLRRAALAPPHAAEVAGPAADAP